MMPLLVREGDLHSSRNVYAIGEFRFAILSKGEWWVDAEVVQARDNPEMPFPTGQRPLIFVPPGDLAGLPH